MLLITGYLFGKEKQPYLVNQLLTYQIMFGALCLECGIVQQIMSASALEQEEEGREHDFIQYLLAFYDERKELSK